jgi:hypothetical protein
VELIFRIRTALADAEYRMYVKLWGIAHGICVRSLRAMGSFGDARQRAHALRMSVIEEHMEYLKREEA